MKSNQSCVVRARPEGYWENTGVTIRPNDQVTIKYVSGSWVSNPHWRMYDAAGNGNYRAPSSYLKPGAAEGALIAKVGGDNSSGGSEVFLIGDMAKLPIGLNGTLWLSVNDEPAGFGDNYGEINVKVTLE